MAALNVAPEQLRFFRLAVHRLDRRRPLAELQQAAGVCGLQNSPPGAWETALFQRLEDCTLADLQKALYVDKSLLQAWSIRGVPLVFPTAESDVFLSPLTARPGEEPWIYTQGVGMALDYLGMPWEEALAAVTRRRVERKEQPRDPRPAGTSGSDRRRAQDDGHKRRKAAQDTADALLAAKAARKQK